MDVSDIPKSAGASQMMTGVSLTALMSASSRRPLNTATSSFIPAKQFEGSKRGYVFTKGEKGLGYYLDKGGEADADVPKEKPMSSEELLKRAEETARANASLDARSVKKLTSAFERKYKDNLDQRTAHPDDPEKFMDAEVDLDEALQDLFQIVNAPDLYPIITESGICVHLLHLLHHENQDIAMDVIQLLSALTDSTDNEELVKQLQSLVTHLEELNIVDVLIERLVQLDEKSDEGGVMLFHLLTTLDNMIDISAAVGQAASQNKQLIKWLFGRLNQSEFDSIKQLSGEMVVELLQHNDTIFIQMHVLDVIMHVLKSIISIDVQSDDELELIGNLFDALCCCLLHSESKQQFLESGGMEMVIDVIKRKKALRISALRVLQFATTQSKKASEYVLKAYGLKILFAFFMQKLKVTMKPDPEGEQKAEEIVLTVISSLMNELDTGSGFERVAAKFVENEFEKSDRLIELYFIYHARVVAAEREIQDMTEPTAEEKMHHRLDSGLATLQHIAMVVSRLWTSGDKALRRRLLLLLHQKGHTLHNVVIILKETVEMMHPEHSQRHRLQECMAHLQGDETPHIAATVAESAEISMDNVMELDGEASQLSHQSQMLTKDELKERISIKRKRQKTKN